MSSCLEFCVTLSRALTVSNARFNSGCYRQVSLYNLAKGKVTIKKKKMVYSHNSIYNKNMRKIGPMASRLQWHSCCVTCLIHYQC